MEGQRQEDDVGPLGTMARRPSVAVSHVSTRQPGARRSRSRRRARPNSASSSMTRMLRGATDVGRCSSMEKTLRTRRSMTVPAAGLATHKGAARAEGALGVTGQVAREHDDLERRTIAAVAEARADLIGVEAGRALIEEDQRRTKLRDEAPGVESSPATSMDNPGSAARATSAIASRVRRDPRRRRECVRDRSCLRD